MPKISVITPTVRVAGVKQVKDSLDRQTMGDFEWIVITPRPQELSGLGDDTIVLEDPPKEADEYWAFNKAMNKAVSHANAPLIVSVQDYTSFAPEGLEKFLYYFENGYDRALVSGVGDKYENGQKVWSDPRKRTDIATFYECFPNDWEMNYGAAPTKMFYDIGGFDEGLDKKAGMDNISIVERADAMGYKFYLDQTNESFSGVHGRLPNWDKEHAMHGFYQARKEFLRKNNLWPVLKYLH